MTEQEKVIHLYRRAGFGYNIRDSYHSTLKQGISELFSASLEHSALFLPGEERITTAKLMEMDKEMRQEVIRDLAAQVKKLNLEWIKLMGRTPGQLREKMALFWHGHFAVRVRGYTQVESYINTVRRYALGNFGDLLMAISKEPAMLRFLNNIQNKKGSPNENFAREVMELFTLGRGNYTETDIKEAARAFTGWGLNKSDEFEFKPFFHDTGQKTIFGKTGAWKGEDVIRLLLERKETAAFITRKIVQFLVGNEVEESNINKLADSFYSNNYNIAELLKTIFESDWFYADSHKGNQIKSPVELLVGINRSFGMSYENPNVLLNIQRILGQTLFFPPNVAGWAGGRNWIDNSTLVIRLSLLSRLSGEITSPIELKDDMQDDTMGEELQNRKMIGLKAQINWELLEERFKATELNELWNSMCAYLIAGKPPIKPESSFNMSLAKNELIKSMALYLAGLPEYQLS